MTASAQLTSKIPSASHPATNAMLIDLITRTVTPDARILDFGAGRGHMADRVSQWIAAAGHDPADHLIPCDIDPDAYQNSHVPCIGVPPDSTLPEGATNLDLIYSIEVIEHLPRPYDFFENCFAALKPGGYLLVTTPNLLHMTARMGFIFRGYPTMFAPPSAKPENAGRISGHIMPLGYGQIHGGMRKAGFAEMVLHVDRVKRGAQALYWALWPFLWLGTALSMRRLQRIEPRLFEETGDVMAELNGHTLATARSCVVLARKPS
jgi:SAM-dependent methyltransferase